VHSAFDAMIVMFAAVFSHDCLSALYAVFCRDDISFTQFIFAFDIFTIDT